MAADDKDVIRLEVVDEAALMGGSPVPVKSKQNAYPIAERSIAHKWADDGTFSYYDNRTTFAKQTAPNPGAILVGMTGLAGVTPTGGVSGGAGTVKAVLEGLKTYIDEATSGTTPPVQNFGAVYAPYGQIFAPITAAATANPILFSQYTNDYLATYHIRRVWIRTDVVASEVALSETGVLQLETTDPGMGNVQLTISGFSGELGTIVIVEDTPGTYAIESTVSGETLGYFVTDNSGLSASSLITVDINLVSTQFSFPATVLGNSSVPNQGSGSRWVFDVTCPVEWTAGDEMSLAMSIGGSSFSSTADFSLSTDTSASKIMRFTIEIQYLGYIDDGGGDEFHDFRAVVTAEASDDIFNNSNLVRTVSLRADVGTFPAQAWFAFTVAAGTTISTFGLLESNATQNLLNQPAAS